MSSPKISVIVPVYHDTGYLAEAMQSIFNQTYSNFEAIVVASDLSDQTPRPFDQFDDPRLKYIGPEENGDLFAPLKAGLRACGGQFIAFLDAADLFHPEKLQAHLAFFDRNPEVDGGYNAHFEVDPAGRRLGFWRPPPTVTLTDLVPGLPLTLSDMVLRRGCLSRLNAFDPAAILFAEELEFMRLLALAGCQLAGLNRTLNYRRSPGPRDVQKRDGPNLSASLAATTRLLETVFRASPCRQEATAWREKALSKTYMIYSYYAFVQGETSLGQDFIRRAIRLDHSILEMQAGKYLEFLVLAALQDNQEHEPPLRRVFEQHPPELAWMKPSCGRAIGRGYLYRGVQAILAGQPEQGRLYLSQAAALDVRPDKPFLYNLLDQLFAYETEFGPAAARSVTRILSQNLEIFGAAHQARWFNSHYFINQALKDYARGRYETVAGNIIRAVSSRPAYLANRGVWSMLFRSIYHSTAILQESA